MRVNNSEVVSREEEKQEKQEDHPLGYFCNDKVIEPSACLLLWTLLLGGVAGAAAREDECVAWGTGKKSKGSFVESRPCGPEWRLPRVGGSKLVPRAPLFPGRLRLWRKCCMCPTRSLGGMVSRGGGDWNVNRLLQEHALVRWSLRWQRVHMLSALGHSLDVCPLDRDGLSG
jgi:hypothetical protein